MICNGHNPVAVQRMGADVGILSFRHQQFLLAQDIHETEEAFRRLSGVIQKLQRRLVGRRFLGSRIMQKALRRKPLAGYDDGTADISAPADNGGAS